MKTQSFSLLAALCIGCSLIGAAQAAEPTAENPKPAKADDNACAWFSSIENWRQLDDSNLLVWTSPREVYHLELSRPLFDLGSTESIGFIDHNHDGRVCGFGMDEIVVPHSSMFGSSTIVGLTRLDDAALAQLAEKYHVKLSAIKKKPKAVEKGAAADISKQTENAASKTDP